MAKELRGWNRRPDQLGVEVGGWNYGAAQLGKRTGDPWGEGPSTTVTSRGGSRGGRQGDSKSTKGW